MRNSVCLVKTPDFNKVVPIVVVGVEQPGMDGIMQMVLFVSACAHAHVCVLKCAQHTFVLTCVCVSLLWDRKRSCFATQP